MSGRVRVVIDTNVLVSGAIAPRGSSAFIMRLFKDVAVMRPADFVALLRDQIIPGDTP